MTVTIAALVLRLARTTAAGADVPAMLADVCRTAQPVLGVRAVVAAAGRPSDPAPTALGGSDDTADRIGRLQREARGGPLAAVIRSGRSLHTVDLTRIGPPELAAAAAEAGLGAALTVPLVVGGEQVGAVQLLGEAGHPIAPDAVEPVAAALEVLAARLADAQDVRRRGPAAAGPDPLDAPTAVIRVTGRRGEPRPGGAGQEGEPGDPTAQVDQGRAAAAARPAAQPGELFRPATGRREPAPAGGDHQEAPTERLPTSVKAGAAALPAPGPHTGAAPSPRSPSPRPIGPSEVRVPAPRYHEPGAAALFAASGEAPEPEPADAGVSGAVDGSAPGRSGRHGRGPGEGPRA